MFGFGGGVRAILLNVHCGFCLHFSTYNQLWCFASDKWAGPSLTDRQLVLSLHSICLLIPPFPVLRRIPSNLSGELSPAVKVHKIRLMHPSDRVKMMAAQADRVMALSEWEGRWQEERIGFHQPHIHQMLKENLDKVVCGRQQVRVFFPLCGKAVDMKWLADMGHVVVGVEISEKAIKQFFEEHSLEYKEEPVSAIPRAKVFKSSDAKISLYQCDLYTFSSAIEGQFGGIWDRGSLVAINPCDRQKYVFGFVSALKISAFKTFVGCFRRYATLILSLMDKDCRYLLDSLEYNPELYKGPPFFVAEEVVNHLYGDACNIKLLKSKDAFEERHKAWGIDSLLEKVYLLTPKASLS